MQGNPNLIGEGKVATEFGKELRKIRVDRDERLMDMADRIKKSAAFLSAIESGRKSPPTGFEDVIVKAYDLTGEAVDRLFRAADCVRKKFTIEPISPVGRDTIGLLARRIHALSDAEMREIRKLLDKGKN